MGYKFLGFVVWKGLNLFLKSKYGSARTPKPLLAIGIKLFKGHARVVTRESLNAVYDAALATFETSGGLFSQQASPGFIELWSLQSRMAYRLRESDAG